MHLGPRRRRRKKWYPRATLGFGLYLSLSEIEGDGRIPNTVVGRFAGLRDPAHHPVTGSSWTKGQAPGYRIAVVGGYLYSSYLCHTPNKGKQVSFPRADVVSRFLQIEPKYALQTKRLLVQYYRCADVHVASTHRLVVSGAHQTERRGRYKLTSKRLEYFFPRRPRPKNDRNVCEKIKAHEYLVSYHDIPGKQANTTEPALKETHATRPH